MPFGLDFLLTIQDSEPNLQANYTNQKNTIKSLLPTPYSLLPNLRANRTDRTSEAAIAAVVPVHAARIEAHAADQARTARPEQTRPAVAVRTRKVERRTSTRTRCGQEN